MTSKEIDVEELGEVLEEAVKELEDFTDQEHEEQEEKIGWLALMCECGQELTYELEHVYSVKDQTVQGRDTVKQSITHGGCPKCDRVVNVKVEVWRP